MGSCSSKVVPQTDLRNDCHSPAPRVIRPSRVGDSRASATSDSRASATSVDSWASASTDIPDVKVASKRRPRISLKFEEETFRLLNPDQPAYVTDHLVPVLGKLPSFRGMSLPLLRSLATEMAPLPLNAGDDVCRKGKGFNKFCVVQSGEFRRSCGKLAVLLTKGDSFGEECLLSDQALSFGVKTVVKGSLWTLDRSVYHRALVKYSSDEFGKISGLLEMVPILAPLDTRQKDRLADALAKVEYRKDELIVRKGEIGDTFYIVAKGTVAVLDENDEGELSEIKRRESGWYFGEGALQSEKGVRNADVKAVTDTVCLQLDKQSFQELLGSLHEVIALNFRRRVLAQINWFKSLNYTQLELIAKSLSEQTFSDGEYICRQGQPGEAFFILKEGQVRVAEGEVNVGQLIAGECFGEGALLHDAPRRANVIADGPVECFVLSRDVFHTALAPLLPLLRLKFEERKGGNSSAVEWEDLQRIKTIGAGSFGSVIIVRHRTTGAPYALKRIKKKKVIAEHQQQSIQRELKICRSIHHPFTINLIRTFKDRDAIYFLTEICLGGELWSLMEESDCFMMDQCQFYAANVALALEYLTGVGVAHRDVKPENLVLCCDGYLKLVDFGFAKAVGVSRTFSLCGTPQFMAPEIYRRIGHGTSVDWWALGVLLFEMASGCSPFETASPEPFDCFSQIVAYEASYPTVVFPSHFSDELAQLLLGLMHPNPAFRFAAKAVKCHAFFKDLDWEALASKKILAPYTPPICSSVDTSHFRTVPELELSPAAPQRCITVKGSLGVSTHSWDEDF